MKCFALAVLLFSLSASADWTGVECSNSDRSVNWKSGFGEDLINLKYSNFVEGTLTLKLPEVNIAFSNEVVLKERSYRSCQNETRGKIFAADIEITASEKSPEVLRSQFPYNKIETTVICTVITKEDTPCD